MTVLQKCRCLLILCATLCALAFSLHAGLLSLSAHAQVPEIKTSGLPVPRFVSLRADKVYVRTGPARRYPIKWVFERKGLPVEIVQEFDTWRKIRDIEGDEGWIHQSLLSGQRYAIVLPETLVSMHESPKSGSSVLARLEPGVVVSLERCKIAWCRVYVAGYRGWIRRSSLWGVYEDEKIN